MVRFISIGCTTAGLMALLSSCNPDTQNVSPSNKPTVAVPANAGTADAGTATPENAAPGTPATGTADPVSKKGSGLEASGLWA
ncbi:hypothetical protein [Leptothoe sp. PORK10 BA2]|uniref:hypothetical protein n=1 Tax=Leptothoe sp. PORK10 BA2 TaxID=3110254 RepID=UPI002B213692|nr:hypothetical protein [Leptothoe sp. PORK10 BA2]